MLSILATTPGSWQRRSAYGWTPCKPRLNSSASLGGYFSTVNDATGGSIGSVALGLSLGIGHNGVSTKWARAESSRSSVEALAGLVSLSVSPGP
jgi:hypothetical protein